ncbi:MAG: hypothetical protein KatS3mg027_2187 [Bacteroidia bacterium]|nr:MAG: hypothetical protein KatS3mg027_2187 [Bacteroidia bacterium]
MKKLCGFFLVLFLSAVGQEEIRVKSIVKEVTVYLQQASLKHRTANFNIPQGQQTIVVENVAISVIPPTIQVRGKGNFVILSTQFRKNYIQVKTISKQIAQLEDSLEYLKNKKAVIDIQINTLDNEEQMILANKSIGGNNTGVTAAELEKVANFYRNRLNEIRTKKNELLPKVTKYQDQIQKLQNQLSELNVQKNKPVGEIIVNVYANTSVNNAELEIEYICNNASWHPQYEIRSNDLSKPLNVLLKAEVVQNTGIDWNNVELTLSTSNPLLNNNKPVLSPWWLEYYVPNVYSKHKKSRYPNAAAPTVAYHEGDAKYSETELQKEEADNLYEYTQVSEKSISQEYNISLPVSIESNSKPARVDINNFEMSSNYLYYAAPKLSDYAYLIAQITDWSKYNLLPATAFIFIENAFVGTSEINPDITKDTLEISMGIDKNISIKREIIKKYNEKKILGNTRKETRGYEISIKNKKKNAVKMIIEDQIPLSSLQEIEVELIESQNASYDKTTGKLQWILDLAPNEEKKVQFKFSVKYPKDKVISNW